MWVGTRVCMRASVRNYVRVCIRVPVRVFVHGHTRVCMHVITERAMPHRTMSCHFIARINQIAGSHDVHR